MSYTISRYYTAQEKNLKERELISFDKVFNLTFSQFFPKIRTKPMYTYHPLIINFFNDSAKKNLSLWQGRKLTVE